LFEVQHYVAPAEQTETSRVDTFAMLRAGADPTEPQRMRLAITLMLVLVLGGSAVAWIYFDRKQQAREEKKAEVLDDNIEKRQALSAFFAKTATDVTAAEIIKLYRTNEIAAREKFLGRPLRIDGLVERVTLERVGDREFPVVYFSEGGACVFNRGPEQPELAKLKKGQRVILLGQPRGPQPGGVEHLTTHCTIDEFYE
jgi:hypothetical protein